MAQEGEEEGRKKERKKERYGTNGTGGWTGLGVEAMVGSATTDEGG